jgi:hypothetical protein
VPRQTFEIGKAFPANKPVARFVAVLAMINNDWLRTTRAMNPAPKDDGEGARLLFMRQQLAYYYEARKALLHFREQEPVATFIESLDASAQERYDAVVSAPEELRELLRVTRNVTFHYPKGRKELAKALRDAKDVTGRITVRGGDSTVRFGFADEVTVQLAGLFDDRKLLKALSEARIALGHFVFAAVAEYVRSLPRGVVRTER